MTGPTGITVVAATAAALWAIALASPREYHHNRLSDYREDDEDQYVNSWKNKEARIQEYLARLREMRVAELESRREALESSRGADIAPLVVPPPRHRPYKWLPAYTPQDHHPPAPPNYYYPRLPPPYRKPDFTYSSPVQEHPSSDFAVPPTDPKFFQQQRIPTEGPGAAAAVSLENDHNTLYSSSTEIQDEVYKVPVSAFQDPREYMIFIAAVAGSTLFVVLLFVFLGIAIYRFQKNVKAAANVDYPAYGVTGPNRESTPTGDRKLAQSAQMYHYQITKQQILCMENNQGGAESEADSEDENEEDYTVYECPGLAPTGEMEVKNPLFVDDPTPALLDAPQQQQQQQQQQNPEDKPSQK